MNDFYHEMRRSFISLLLENNIDKRNFMGFLDLMHAYQCYLRALTYSEDNMVVQSNIYSGYLLLQSHLLPGLGDPSRKTAADLATDIFRLYERITDEPR